MFNDTHFLVKSPTDSIFSNLITMAISSMVLRRSSVLVLIQVSCALPALLQSYPLVM